MSPSPIKSYVMRASRMSAAQKKAYDMFSPQWVIPSQNIFRWEDHFPSSARRIVEIGFGMGDATRELALTHSDWAILGIEVHKPGVGKLLWWMHELGLKNIRIIHDDAVDAIQNCIPHSSVDAVHIWFPDPWPKKRHHKRRLLQKPVVRAIMHILKKDGIIHIATDWQPYADEIIAVLNQTPGLTNQYSEWAPKPDYRPYTKFERRGIAENRIIRDIIFVKEVT